MDICGDNDCILVWTQVAIADELPNCKAIRNASKKMQCLQISIAMLQKQATGNIVQMGSKAFSQNQSDSPNWSLAEHYRAISGKAFVAIDRGGILLIASEEVALV
jgi:hypothetical protein